MTVPASTSTVPSGSHIINVTHCVLAYCWTAVGVAPSGSDNEDDE